MSERTDSNTLIGVVDKNVELSLMIFLYSFEQILHFLHIRVVHESGDSFSSSLGDLIGRRFETTQSHFAVETLLGLASSDVDGRTGLSELESNSTS